MTSNFEIWKTSANSTVSFTEFLSIFSKDEFRLEEFQKWVVLEYRPLEDEEIVFSIYPCPDRSAALRYWHRNMKQKRTIRSYCSLGNRSGLCDFVSVKFETVLPLGLVPRSAPALHGARAVGVDV